MVQLREQIFFAFENNSTGLLREFDLRITAGAVIVNWMGAAADENGAWTEFAASASASVPETATISSRCELVFRPMSMFARYCLTSLVQACVRVFFDCNTWREYLSQRSMKRCSRNRVALYHHQVQRRVHEGWYLTCDSGTSVEHSNGRQAFPLYNCACR